MDHLCYFFLVFVMISCRSGGHLLRCFIVKLSLFHWYPGSDVFVCLFVIVALRPMSTAMVIAGRSVHLTTLFPGQA